VYPGKDGDFTLYDDDGVTYAYEKGVGTSTKLHWNDAAGVLSASGGDKALERSATSLLRVIGR
jgi:alpha-D-xyloside xylohydrolase